MKTFRILDHRALEKCKYDLRVLSAAMAFCTTLNMEGSINQCFTEARTSEPCFSTVYNYC